MATGMSTNVVTHWTGSWYQPWRKPKGLDEKPSRVLESVEFEIQGYSTSVYPDEGSVGQLYRLDYGTVRQKASSYRGMASSLTGCLNSIKEAHTALDNAWDGEAAFKVDGRVAALETTIEARIKDLEFVAGCLEGLARMVEEMRSAWMQVPSTGLVYRP